MVQAQGGSARPGNVEFVVIAAMLIALVCLLVDLGRALDYM
jgi:Flp pilus assembly protein TadG